MVKFGFHQKIQFRKIQFWNSRNIMFWYVRSWYLLNLVRETAGEAGTTPTLALLINAIVDALSEYGVIKHIDMLATPQRV